MTALPGSRAFRDRWVSQPLHLLIGLSLILPPGLFAAAAAYDRSLVVEAARHRVMTTALTLAEHAQKVVETNQFVLRQILDRTRGMSWDEIAGSAELHAFLTGLNRDLPQFESVFLATPWGTTAASSRAFPMPPYDVTMRDYFAAAKAGTDAVFVSAPFRGQRAGTMAFTMTRARLTGGRFDGLAGITVSPRYFEQFYRTIVDQPGLTYAGLIRADGVRLVRYPPMPEQDRVPPPSRVVTFTAEGGVFDEASPFDGHPTLVGFRRLAGLPLLVAFAVDHEAVLEPWYRHLVIFAIFSVVLGATLLPASLLALGRTRRERHALHRLLAEQTRREQAEQALAQARKMEALGHLTGGIAHDFNNLLAAVTAALDMARGRVTDDKARRYLATIQRAVDRGIALTRRMLTFSRGQPLLMTAVDLGRVLVEMGDLLARSIGPAITVDLRADPGLWPARADASQFEIAILNLAINARDAMPEGGTLTITTRRLGHDPAMADDAPADLAAGDYAVVSVTDTGIGMPEAVRERAVDPFFTTKGVGKGTGLGLSMVYGLTRQAGGSLRIDSAPGQGTTVHLYFPRAGADEGAEEAGRIAVESKSAGFRVLLVEDDDDVRSLLDDMLCDLGHKVVAVAGGAAALDHLRGPDAVDLMIIDYAMPGMNGAATAIEARGLRPSLPILFMTGYADGDVLRQWSGQGHRILKKPFRMNDLVEAIAAARP